jgi:hypothetical protein
MVIAGQDPVVLTDHPEQFGLAELLTLNLGYVD